MLIKKITLFIVLFVTSITLLPSQSSEVPELLLQIQEEYEDIHNIVHDPLFGLKSWMEFQEEVNQLTNLWENYKCIPEADIIENHENLNISDHRFISLRLEECLIDFLRSLETGFQPNFAFPCDTLGKSIHELIKLFEKE
jgi:hypothetical protein